MQRRRLCTDQRGDSLSQKRIPPLEPPEKGLGLAVSGLNNSDVSEVKVPRARRSRVSIARRFASAPIIRCCAAVGGSAALRMRHTPCGCRSAHLVEVRSNSRLSGLHGEAMYTAPDCAARAVIQAPDCQCRGSRGRPSSFSGGFKGGILFEKRIPPLPRAPRQAGPPYSARGAAKLTHLC